MCPEVAQPIGERSCSDKGLPVKNSCVVHIFKIHKCPNGSASLDSSSCQQFFFSFVQPFFCLCMGVKPRGSDIGVEDHLFVVFDVSQPIAVHMSQIERGVDFMADFFSSFFLCCLCSDLGLFASE